MTRPGLELQSGMSVRPDIILSSLIFGFPDFDEGRKQDTSTITGHH